MIDAHACSGVAYQRNELPLWHAAHAQGKADVLGHSHVRIERVALEDHGNVTFARTGVRDILIIEQDVAGTRNFETGDQTQRRRLAGARRPKQREKLIRSKSRD